MGKRKSRKKPIQKPKKPVLDRVFNCPFCGHEKTVDCTISKSKGIGSVSCRVCQASYTAEVTHLDEAVDVYAEWIDKTVQVSFITRYRNISNSK